MLILKIHSEHIHYLVNFYNKLNLSKINLYLSNLVKILSEWIILIGTRGKKVIALSGTPRENRAKKNRWSAFSFFFSFL